MLQLKRLAPYSNNVTELNAPFSQWMKVAFLMLGIIPLMHWQWQIIATNCSKASWTVNTYHIYIFERLISVSTSLSWVFIHIASHIMKIWYFQNTVDFFPCKTWFLLWNSIFHFALSPISVTTCMSNVSVCLVCSISVMSVCVVCS